LLYPDGKDAANYLSKGYNIYLRSYIIHTCKADKLKILKVVLVGRLLSLSFARGAEMRLTWGIRLSI
jgi:hypothetical protein